MYAAYLASLLRRLNNQKAREGTAGSGHSAGASDLSSNSSKATSASSSHLSKNSGEKSSADGDAGNSKGMNLMDPKINTLNDRPKTSSQMMEESLVSSELLGDGEENLVRNSNLTRGGGRPQVTVDDLAVDITAGNDVAIATPRFDAQDLEAFALTSFGRLTTRQQQLLKYTFPKMQSEKESLAIFVRLFQEHPEHKKFFPSLRSLTDIDLNTSKELRNFISSHYLKGMHIIIDSLTDGRVLMIQLKLIAKAHKRRGVQKNHMEDMIPVVHQSLKQSVSNYTVEIEEAWAKYLTILASVLEKLKRA